MTLEPGRDLLHYRLVEKIGEGGMGQVWLARDVRLERDVAVKVLPAGFATNEQFRLRFEREGKTISALNHPHICTLFDVGHEGDTHFLVMERLEGESLADRLKSRGPLPLAEVLELGAQVASALSAAHRAGIVHRDLKPDNVMLTRSGAKLVDFGLAKTSVEGPPPIDGLSSLPTQAKPLTQEGTILGTFQYMAPEQLEGLEADARTDIFALGALLYEMATGRHAFDGHNKTSLIAAIVSSQPPPISNVQTMTPPAFEHLVRKCLEKDPEDRWQSAGDVAGQLRFISTEGSQVTAAPSAIATTRRRGAKLPWIVAGLLAVVAAALAVFVWTRTEPVPEMTRASLIPPADTALFPFDQLGLALSPDGTRLAFATNEPEGGQRIWMRELSSMTASPVPGTEGGSYPFWSPDGIHLGFFSNGKLRRVDLRGGSPRDLADAPSGRGASWSTAGVMLFAPNITAAIHSVPADGGEARPLTPYDPELETTQRWPHFLPDGQHFFFLSRASHPNGGEHGRLMLASLDDPQPRLLIDDSTNAVYVEPGRVVFGRGGDLASRPFDLAKLRFTGPATPLLGEPLSFWEPKNYIAFTASNDGKLIYLPESVRRTVLQFYDRGGRPLETLVEPGFWITPKLSPDATQIVVVRGKLQSSEQDIWVHDLTSGRENRQTFEKGDYGDPRWSHDGTRLAFECMPGNVRDVCVKSLAAGDAGRVVYRSPNWNSNPRWTADGEGLVFTEQDPETGQDILGIDLTGTAEPRVVVRTPINERDPEISPDGRWLAHTSDESGRSEIYVRDFEEPSHQWLVSVEGGLLPRWRGDGRELFYIEPDGDVMAVPIEASGTFRAGSPEKLFTVSEPPLPSSPVFEDVTPDGRRFLLNLPVESRSSLSFDVVFHWPALLEDSDR